MNMVNMLRSCGKTIWAHPMKKAGNQNRKILRFSLHNEETIMEVVASWDRLCQAPGFSARIQGIAKRELLKNFVIPAQGKTFMAKVYTNKDLGRFLLSMCHFGEAERNGSTLAYLANQSIYVTRPLCLLREYRNGLVSKSVLFLEKLPETAIDYKTYLPETLPGQSQPFRINFFAQAGRAIGQMHKTGVYTEDTDQNLMVEKKGNVFTFHFLDFDNFYPWRIPTRNRTIHAISHAVDTGKQIKYTCNALETEAFVNAYLAARGKPQWYQTIMDALKTSRPHIFEHPTCPPVNA